MILKFIWPAAAFAVLSVPQAQAISITSERVLEGANSISVADFPTGPCCRIVPVDSPVQVQQFGLTTGSDRIDPGEGIEVRPFEGGDTGQPPDVTGSQLNMTGSSFPRDVSRLHEGSTTLTQGTARFEATSGSFDRDRLHVRATALFTVEVPVFATRRQKWIYGGGVVRNIRQVSTNSPPPPGSDIPLPAAGLRLGSVLAGLPR